MIKSKSDLWGNSLGWNDKNSRSDVKNHLVKDLYIHQTAFAHKFGDVICLKIQVLYKHQSGFAHKFGDVICLKILSPLYTSNSFCTQIWWRHVPKDSSPVYTSDSFCTQIWWHHLPKYLQLPSSASAIYNTLQLLQLLQHMSIVLHLLLFI